MSTLAPSVPVTDPVVPTAVAPARPRRPSRRAALAALTRRRLALSARTPREVLVPLLAPVLFAVIIAPALDSLGPRVPGVDYMSFAAVGIAGLLIPLNCMFSGIGVIVDREGGARRDLLAAPVPRPLLVAANLAVALAVTGLQVAVLIGAVVLRGAELDVRVTGVAWFVAAAALLTVAMYGVAETVANRLPSVEDFTGTIPPIAIVPFFFAGSLFPITALPAWLTGVARVLPLTHALALMRYGLLGTPIGLEDIWGHHDPTVMAALSLAVVAAFAAALTAVAVRTFRRAAVR
jgi:ABC-2 type transport system permease protein